MAVLDPFKRAKGIIKVNILGSIAGGVAGAMLVRKFSPIKGWLGMTVGVLGGALGGAYIQNNMKAKAGASKSATQAKK